MTQPSPATIERPRNPFDPDDFPFDRMTKGQKAFVVKDEIVSAGYLLKGAAAKRCGATAREFSLLVADGVFPAHFSGTMRWHIEALDDAVKRATISGEDRGYVYFMRVQGFIKIGHSVWPHSRMSDLQGSNPHEITLLMTMRGSLEDEAKIHVLFRHLRVRGEWFRSTRGLLAYMGWLKRRRP